MPTELKAAKYFFLLHVLLIGHFFSLAQEKADTVNIRPFERYWTKPRIVPKVGFGVQRTGFGEIGAQLHQIYVHPLSLASMGPYITVDAVFNVEEIIIGPKAGYELTAGLFGIAADVSYYTDMDRESIMVTPKAGLTIFGYANLFYGRNIRLSEDHFKSISANRISLTFNLNKDYYSIRGASKKRQRTRDQ